MRPSSRLASCYRRAGWAEMQEASPWKRAARIAPFLVGAWSVAAFLAAGVSGLAWTTPPAPDEVALTQGGLVLRSAIAGALIGSASAWLETAVLPGFARRLPLAAALTIRTLAYAAVVVAVVFAVMFSTAFVLADLSPGELVADPRFSEFLETGTLLRFVTVLIAASFVINLALQLRRVLGPATLRALALGTYRRPREEDRVFLFLDLTDSTAIAERLGPLRFTDFKNDFFADVAEPVLATGGRIVQYVGDEVMVSWPMAPALKSGAPLRFFALVEARISGRAERYRHRYGIVPAFKAGCHGGPVVTAEVGDLKRDIVHSGDVVNTAARIEAECRPRGERLLLSAALAAAMPVPEGLTIRELGEVSLRGKAEAVAICAVRPARLGENAEEATGADLVA
ncbi:MAG: adenylate/guanylate cyclase domain-containing protein [Bacteroidota bacterium]